MRIVNRVLAVAAALGLAAGGVLVIVEVALASLGRGPWLIGYDDWYSSARTNQWDAPGARSLFLVLTLAGAVLVALQLVKPRPRSIPLEPGVARAGIARRSVEQTLAHMAGNETGVATATARIRRRRVKVVAATIAPPDELRPRLEEVAHTRLRDLGLDGRLDVALDVHQRAK
jgi:uncharacterized protein DUF6286